MKNIVKLKPGKERRIQSGWPWVTRADLAEVPELAPGSLVEVRDPDGDFVAIGTFFAPSHAAIRILSLVQAPIDGEFFKKAFSRCQRARQRLKGAEAVREVFSEADGLPGLIVDRYGEHAVVQVRTIGMDALKPVWLPALVEAYALASVFERSDYASRSAEGMEPFTGQLHGTTPDEIEITENEVKYLVSPKSGLKTGHFLDQRQARAELGEAVHKGDTVLDLFCFTGGFSLASAKAGATALGVDSSEESVETARRNAALNKLEAKFEAGNAFEFLMQDRGSYDWIVLDPPAIAKHKGEKKALRQAVYKLVRLAAPRLSEKGVLLVCSCSHQLGIEEMLAACTDGADDADVRLSLTKVTLQDTDHPAPLHFPEALYLKCLWLKRLAKD